MSHPAASPAICYSTSIKHGSGPRRDPFCRQERYNSASSSTASRKYGRRASPGAVLLIVSQFETATGMVEKKEIEGGREEIVIVAFQFHHMQPGGVLVEDGSGSWRARARSAIMPSTFTRVPDVEVRPSPAVVTTLSQFSPPSRRIYCRGSFRPLRYWVLHLNGYINGSGP